MATLLFSLSEDTINKRDFARSFINKTLLKNSYCIETKNNMCPTFYLLTIF